MHRSYRFTMRGDLIAGMNRRHLLLVLVFGMCLFFSAFQVGHFWVGLVLFAVTGGLGVPLARAFTAGDPDAHEIFVRAFQRFGKQQVFHSIGRVRR